MGCMTFEVALAAVRAKFPDTYISLAVDVTLGVSGVPHPVLRARYYVASRPASWSGDFATLAALVASLHGDAPVLETVGEIPEGA